MSLPQVYVHASTLGDFLNGEQRHIEEYTRVVTYDGIELFRTTGTLDPNDLLYRADQHTLLHNACVAAFPDGYDLIWSEPPVAQDPTDEGTIDIEAHLEAVTGADSADQVPPVADVAEAQPGLPVAEPAQPELGSADGSPQPIPSVPDQHPVAADTAGVQDTTLNTKDAK